MDDDMEDEIICEIFVAHFYLMQKYVSLASSNLATYVIPAPEDNFRKKLFKPGSVLLLTVVIIISSFILQSSWLKKVLLYCHKSLNFNVVADNSLKCFVTKSIGSENASHQLTEGIVGVYALQGRRGTMEDRFSVMQEVEVGGVNKLSFFGVYDGHGGQFVAEYVKQNLFINTVQKIRQLRSLNKEINNLNQCKQNSSLAAKNKVNENILSTIEFPTLATTQNTSTNEKDLNSCPKENSSVILERESIEEITNNKGKEKKQGCNLEDIRIEENGDKNVLINIISDVISLKKEDPYSNLKKRKKSVIHTIESPKESDTSKDNINNLYIDVNSNVNYTKLLNDQIMDIDKKVVDFCKCKTDLSGTTAVVAVLDGELLIIGNVGDSRAVMGDFKGSTIPLSFDHKPNQLKERRRIKEAGGFITFTGVWRVAGILATSRALGDFPLKDPRKLITAEPDVLTFSLKDHKADFVILATDGLWDVLSNEEAVAFVRNHIHEKDHGARSLVLHAYDRGSQDNITVMILNLSKLSL